MVERTFGLQQATVNEDALSDISIDWSHDHSGRPDGWGPDLAWLFSIAFRAAPHHDPEEVVARVTQHMPPTNIPASLVFQALVAGYAEGRKP